MAKIEFCNCDFIFVCNPYLYYLDILVEIKQIPIGKIVTPWGPATNALHNSTLPLSQAPAILLTKTVILPNIYIVNFKKSPVR